VVSRGQLFELGFTRNGIHHRIERGRLYLIHRSVYAVGRRQLTQHGFWMAAVLSCGPGSAVSHGDAGALYGFRPTTKGLIHVSVPVSSNPRRPGIAVHRRAEFDTTSHLGIPVTTPIQTLIDLATQLNKDQLEGAVNEADAKDLTTPERLRSVLADLPSRPGVPVLRQLLDRRTFRRTQTWLERRFLPIVRRAGLPLPLTQQYVNGFRVDFYWPDLDLVVETDGLRYHRTPGEQARDRVRDQAHLAAGLTPLRFTHAQVRYEPAYVQTTLSAVAQAYRASSA
jgi:very-short-patch-repair endonuclease